MSLTHTEENLYNEFLIVTRTVKNQPLKLRRNFSQIDDKIILSLKKLNIFFKKHKHIVPYDFFIAPYKVYQDEDYFDITYFTTLKAVKAFSVYQQMLANSSPDSDEQILFTQKSLKTILEFCRKERITLPNYITHKLGVTPTFLLHLKEHKVNIYTLLGFENFEIEFKKIESDMVKFMLNEQIYEQIQKNKIKFYGSKKLQQLVNAGLARIKNILQKEVD